MADKKTGKKVAKGKKGKFAAKGKSILKPKSMSEFMDGDKQSENKASEEKTVNTEISNYVNTEDSKDVEKKVRHELQINYDLSEKIREYCFLNRTTKRATVELALTEFFKNNE